MDGAPSKPVTSTRHAGLLGTVVEITSRALTTEASEAAHGAVIAEIGRLQKVFDAFDAESDLRRWSAGVAPATEELVEVIELAEFWRHRSNGVFEPAAALLTVAWDRAAARDSSPSADELDDLVVQLGAARRPTAPAWDAPTIPYALNAIAKGWIVDRAIATGWLAAELDDLVVNAGGDLAHRGVTSVTVGVEDPANPYDNVAPLLAVPIVNAALATSGSARRGWTIGGSWYPHVLDPRTGWPVGHHASVTVIARDAATADAVATVIGVLPTDAALSFAASCGGLACCLIAADGTVTRSASWAAVELTPRS